VAALVLKRNPGWTPGQVRDRLRESCDKIGGVAYDEAGHHENYGYGRINAERAVTGLRPRRFALGGEPVQMSEVIGLFATATGDGTAGVEGEEGAPGPLQGKGLQALDAQDVASSFPALRPEDAVAFQDEGWTFFRSAGRPRPDAPVAKVLILAGSQPVLSTSRLTLRTAESVPESRLAELLAPHGGRILERIEFAPGLYRVAVDPPDGRDVLDVAGALEGLDGIEFAEPEFVAVIAGRA
jgi:hypothetical protein